MRRNIKSTRILVTLLLAVLLGAEAFAAEPNADLAAAPRVSPPNALPNKTAAAADQSQRAEKQIQSLIRQLGDPRYAARRAAATELRQIGPEAFDLLHAATSDADPEVAASARYLLRQIAVRWVQNDDSAAVRAMLRDYDRQPDNARLTRVEELVRLPQGEGVAALCRIARFDRSPIVSRMAALAIIRPARRSSTAPNVDPEVIERELGTSTRTSADWLRRYLIQVRDPAASVEYWQKLIDEEAARLEHNASDTSPAIVVGLLWNLADVYRQLGNSRAMVSVVDRMVGVDPNSLELTSVELMNWLSEHRSWEVLDEFLAKHEEQLKQSKRPLYYAALARSRQGKKDVAEQLAELASKLEPQKNLESFATAKELSEQNQFEWAVREYRRAIDNQKIASQEGILARVHLAALLHDYAKHREAADEMDPLAKAVKNEGQVGQLYADIYRYWRGRLNLPKADGLSARLHFYRGLQYVDEKDFARAREEFDRSITLDPTDADVIIAMYRVPESDEKFRAEVMKRIADLTRDFQQQIDENPDNPEGYNQWAWLVSNTEGDYQKAIRYSHRSLELIPEGADESAGGSFLDTLGRCYYAAGDLENAVKYQRQAIEKVDYMQVMRRQLELFEKELAGKNAAKNPI